MHAMQYGHLPPLSGRHHHQPYFCPTRPSPSPQPTIQQKNVWSPHPTRLTQQQSPAAATQPAQSIASSIQPTPATVSLLVASLCCRMYSLDCTPLSRTPAAYRVPSSCSPEACCSCACLGLSRTHKPQQAAQLRAVPCGCTGNQPDASLASLLIWTGTGLMYQGLLLSFSNDTLLLCPPSTGSDIAQLGVVPGRPAHRHTDCVRDTSGQSDWSLRS